MNSLRLFSYPKINLALDILGVNASTGFHFIQTVLHEVKEPFDEITLEVNNLGKCEVRCDDPRVPRDETNTALKAALLLKKYIGSAAKNLGVTIDIKKKIPLMSGLGGGSSDAVATLKGLAQLWNVHCCKTPNTHEDSSCLLKKIGNEIGMDCAFFFVGGTALAEHFGEKITPLPPLPSSIKIKIIDTGVQVSTKWAYEHIDIKKTGKNLKKTEALIEAIKNGDANGVIKNNHNDFESLIFEKYPELAKAGHLSGSGGATFKCVIVS